MTETVFRLKRHLTSFQIMILGFAGVILLGALVLMLPIATVQRVWTPFHEALFTSTSAVCVTGLVVQDTGSYWSAFGQTVILLLIQIGGLGVITGAVPFLMLAGRNITLKERSAMQDAISAPAVGGIVRLTRFILKGTFLVELLGALALLPAFCRDYGLRGVWMSVFHSVSAFCNAGFDLFGRFGQYSSLAPYVSNYYVQAVIMFLIMAGGLGFMVWVEIGEWRKKRHLSLHARMVLLFSCILWVGGAALIGLMEWNNPKSMGGLSVPGKVMAALFQSVSTRTAGMNTVDLAACGPITKLLMSVLQFIGAAPGSTGGGVKVTTFAVIILTIRSVAQGRDDCVIADHHIESKTVYRALTIIVLGAAAVIGSAIVCTTTPRTPCPWWMPSSSPARPLVRWAFP